MSNRWNLDALSGASGWLTCGVCRLCLAEYCRNLVPYLCGENVLVPMILSGKADLAWARTPGSCD